MTIPKIIHQIWLSDISDIPEKYKLFSSKWKDEHNDFKYILWGDEIYDEFGGKNAFLKKYNLDKIHPAQISDVLRVLLLQRYGGFYIDIDSECKSNISELIDNKLVCYFHGYSQDRVHISYDFIGAIPNHDFINSLLSDIEKEVNNNYIDPLYKYGFKKFQDKIILESCSGITILGAKVISKYLKHHFYNSWR